jgi:hypothetical protein
VLSTVEVVKALPHAVLPTVKSTQRTPTPNENIRANNVFKLLLRRPK